MATELGTGYVSIVAETSKLEAGIKKALQGGGSAADVAGKDIGSRISAQASKALKSGWRPDQDIMAGIPNTKLDRIGARMGQVIGKGAVAGMRGKQIGAEFGQSFASGVGSVGLGRVIAGWRSELGGRGAMNSIGMVAGKALSSGLTAGAGLAIAGIGLSLTKGFDRLVALDTAKNKLESLNKAAAKFGKPMVDVQQAVKDVTDVVSGTPFSLDAAFGTAVGAIGAGVKDVKGYMTSVADAAAMGGTTMAEMGDVFQDIVNKGNVTGEALARLDTRFPATSWIKESVAASGKDFDDMLAKGEVTMEMLQQTITDHAGGMAKGLGDTLQGAMTNMQTAVARVGANFLTALFGGESGDPAQGMKESINTITAKLNELDSWIRAHREDIKTFFNGAKDAAAEVVTVIGNISNFLKEHPDLIKKVFEAFLVWKTLKFTGLLSGLSNVSDALGSKKGGVGLLGKLALVAEAMNLIDDFTGRKKPGEPGEFMPSDPLNDGPSLGKQGLDVAAGAWLGSKIGGVPGALLGGLTAGTIRPGIDIIGGGPGPASNGVLPPNLPNIGASSGQTNTLAGIPIPGLTQSIDANTAPAKSALDDLRQGQTEPIVIPADSDTAPAAQTTTEWRTDEAGRPVEVTVNANVGPANSTLEAFFAKWSAAIISPRVVVPGQGTPGPGGGPPTLGQLLGVPGKALGGGIFGPGTGTSDSIPAMLSDGEHVLTASDVKAMGGQSSVYAFRAALHMAQGGSAFGDKVRKTDKTGPGQEGQDRNPFSKEKERGLQPGMWWETTGPGKGVAIDLPWWFESGMGQIGRGRKRIKMFAKGGAASLSALHLAKGGDGFGDGVRKSDKRGPGQEGQDRNPFSPETTPGLQPGQGWGTSGPSGTDFGWDWSAWIKGGFFGPSILNGAKRIKMFAKGGAASLKDMRTAGAMPAAAGNTAPVGGSALSGIIDMGGEIINGVIDQAASAVSTAASAAAMAGSVGAAGPVGGEAAGAASQFAIGLASDTAKRGISYGFDLLGIGVDSLLEQLTPFGQPRLLNQDVSGFVPQEAISGALKNLMTGGANKAAGNVDPNTTEHGTAQGAEPGAVPGPLENFGQQIFEGFSKVLPSGPIEPVTPTAMVGETDSFLSTQLTATDAPPPGQQPIFKIDNVYTQDVDSLGRELNKRGRLAQIQYTNRPGP